MKCQSGNSDIFHWVLSVCLFCFCTHRNEFTGLSLLETEAARCEWSRPVSSWASQRAPPGGIIGGHIHSSCHLLLKTKWKWMLFSLCPSNLCFWHSPTWFSHWKQHFTIGSFWGDIDRLTLAVSLLIKIWKRGSLNISGFPVHVRILIFNIRKYMETGAEWSKTLPKLQIIEKEQIVATK